MAAARKSPEKPSLLIRKALEKGGLSWVPHRGEAMLSFLREHCIRGNARKFRIFLDGREVERISLDSQCHVSCSVGFHKVYVKLDSLTSPVVNLKAEAGQRYYFDIACTMNEGMILQRIEEKKEEQR